MSAGVSPWSACGELPTTSLLPPILCLVLAQAKPCCTILACTKSDLLLLSVYMLEETFLSIGLGPSIILYVGRCARGALHTPTQPAPADLLGLALHNLALHNLASIWLCIDLRTA